MSLPRGRPTVSMIEPLRTITVGASIHAGIAKLAAELSYANGCDRKVTIREIVEGLILERYPEIRKAAEDGVQAGPSEEDIFSEIVMRAMAGAQDPEANWNGAGDKVAIELPSPVTGQPNAQFRLADLAYYLFRKMQKDEPTDHITTVRELVKDMVGW